MTGTEVPLGGGNMSGGVVRVGGTVRRPAGPWTPAVHALLAHLRDAGFDGAPRPLGTDERGREVLTFIPGTVAWPGGFGLLDGDAPLRRAARLIRDFHDAVAGFTPPPGARWQALLPAGGGEIIAHNDLAPWNLVIGDGGWAFIDWDSAAPGTRLQDLAYAMHGFAPLSASPAYQRGDDSPPAGADRGRLRAHRGPAAAHRPAARPAAPRPCTTSCGAGRPGHPAVGAAMARGPRRGLAGRRRYITAASRPAGARRSSADGEC